MCCSSVCIKFIVLVVIINCSKIAAQRPRDNGDIYVRRSDQIANSKTSTNENGQPIVLQENNNSSVNVEEIMNICNSSFSIPIDYIIQFNTTGELPDTTDKTGMCYIRCYFEKSGLIENWKLNKDLVMSVMWPIMYDSIDACEREEKNEINACVRTYAIAKCLMTRTLYNVHNQT
ncbi:general odorant-binding protein 84a isoform X2 [Eurosta solidaginis]|uniref:general odorant-binding protein 84a isoform X2 n=1 Tax=Eurosta solidaginis TaxID=178769 RepID=UPI003531778D